jgi:hypothetical protein
MNAIVLYRIDQARNVHCFCRFDVPTFPSTTALWMTLREPMRLRFDRGRGHGYSYTPI